jgi:hypothetical protein
VSGGAPFERVEEPVYVEVHLAATPPSVTLVEPDDCGRFHLVAVGAQDPARLGEVLAGVGLGCLAGEDVFVRVDAVRSLAAGRVGEAWDADFDRMLDYARSKGWLDETGEAIQAHMEWDVPA